MDGFPRFMLWRAACGRWIPRSDEPPYRGHERVFPTTLSPDEDSAIRDCIANDMQAYRAPLELHGGPWQAG